MRLIVRKGGSMARKVPVEADDSPMTKGDTAGRIKCLTLLQPWASLVALNARKIETRSWRTWYRGPLLIHAARAFPKSMQNLCKQEPFAKVLAEAGYTHARSGQVDPGRLP